MTAPQQAIDRLEIGSKSSFSKRITAEDVRKFAEVSGDFNPLHLEDEYAARTIFGERIAHGILALGLVSAALAKLPGVVVYLSQSVRFTRPVKIGDVIDAVAEVEEITTEKGQVRLKTICQNQRGEQVLEGEARVRLYDLK